jgi:aldose 1-epimerase
MGEDMMKPIYVRSIATTLAALLAGAPALAAAPQVEAYGTLKDGRAVQRYTLTNAHGMVVRILSYGGIITEISVPDRAGKLTNVVPAKPDLAGYESGANFSSLLGPYANRISGGGFTLDGKRYDLAGANATGMVLHSGPKAFSEQVWDGKPFGGARGPTGVTLSHLSPDGFNGFPGNLKVEAKFTLGDDDTLRLEWRANTDKPTVVNFSHHVYFNLAGGMAGIADDQCLQINSDRYGALKAQAMTGELPPVDGTPFDLRRPTRLGDRVNKGYELLPRTFDTPFVIRNGGKAMVPAASAWDPVSGRTMQITTTEPSLQLFTPGFNPGAPRPPMVPGAPPPPPPPPSPHVAVYAIETQHLPQSPNFPDFPTTVLRPGQTFRTTTAWHFGTYDPASGVCPMAKTS